MHIGIKEIDWAAALQLERNRGFIYAPDETTDATDLRYAEIPYYNGSKDSYKVLVRSLDEGDWWEIFVTVELNNDQTLWVPLTDEAVRGFLEDHGPAVAHAFPELHPACREVAA